MTDLTVASFHRRESGAAARAGLRTAAAIIAACLAVHALNGLVLERIFLDLEGYRDYADVAKLRDAFGSPLWIASGLAHLVTSAAVVWFGINLARLADEDRPTLAQAVRIVCGIAATGFVLLGVTLLQATGSTSLIAEESPAQADAAYTALSVVNVVADGLAIASVGVLVFLAARYGKGRWPRWFVRLSYVAALCGLVQAFFYLPLFLFVGLAWFVSLVVVLSRPAD